MATGLALVAASCTGSGGDQAGEEPSLGSRTVDPADLTAADGDGTAAGAGDGSDGTGGSAVDLAPSTIEPTDTFQRLDATQFGHVSAQIAIEDAVALDDGTWLVVGGLEDGRARTVQAVGGVLSSNDPGRNRRFELPAGDAEHAIAFGVARQGDVIRIVGRTEAGGRSTPVVWTGDTDLETWELTTLPSPSTGPAQAFELIDGPEVTYALGSTTTGGLNRPLVWRRAGATWQSLDVESDADRNVVATAGVVVDQALVAVGTSTGAFGDPAPVIWVEGGGSLTVAVGTGLPRGGVLNGVARGPGGEVVVVGATTVDAISTPLVATADRVGDRWVVESPTLDIAGWISFDGLQFEEVTVDGDDLLATLSNPVVQQLFRSGDRGRTWTRTGDLGFAAGNVLPANGLAIDPGGQVLVAGGDVAMVLVGTDWQRVTDQAAYPSQLGAYSAVDVAAGPAGFLIGGGLTGRSGDGVRYEAVVWQSPDGVSWGRPPLTEPEAFAVYDVVLGADGQPAALKGGGGFFNIAGIDRPEPSGRWRSTPLALGEAFLFHALPGPGGTIVAAGIRPEPGPELDVLGPLFVVIEPDDSVREIPLTDSPIDEDTNAEVSCLAGAIGDLLAVVEWGDGEVGVVRGPNGERWSGRPTTGLGGRLDITSCHRDAEGPWLAAGQDADGRAVVASSDDGATWSVETVADQGSVLGIDDIDGRTLLTGWTPSPDGQGTDATIWRLDGGDWTIIDDTGLESDAFARATDVSGLAARNGIVVAIGTDRGRAGAWVATTAVLDR